MAATFLLSFDCEGKWGFADALSDHHRRHLDHTPLVTVYQRLLDLLARYQIRASFAFVAALTLSPDQAASHPEWFVDTPPGTHPWLRLFRQDWQAGHTGGWFEPQLLEQVKAHPEHEIACHGFSHLPLAESLTDRETAHWELHTAQAVARLHGLQFHTLVYPRNLCGYPEVLPELGFIGYRQGHVAPPNTVQRLSNLATECWPWPSAQPHGSSAHPLVIPAGGFLNWRHGPRRCIPSALTVARWEHALRDAQRHDGVVHLFSHPHNFIDGDGQFDLLEHILARVAARRGELDNPTLRDYCQPHPQRTNL